jgi:hypothetical protein
VLQLDVCLLGMVENAYQLRSMARYLIVSENLAWSAFAYESYRAAVGAHTLPRELAVAIADRYAQRVADHQGADGPLPYTISVLEMDQLDQVILALDTLALRLQRLAFDSPQGLSALQDLRLDAQTLDADASFSLTPDDDYIDLAHWATLLQTRLDGAEVRDAAQALSVALVALVVHERHGSGTYFVHQLSLEHAGGLGIYYPTLPSARTYQTYLRGSGLSFPLDTSWDDLLASVLPNDLFARSKVSAAAAPLKPISVQSRLYLPSLLRS